MINPSPSVIIPDAFALPSGVLPNTVYIGYLPASTITLSAVASGGTPGYSYSWSSGSLISSTTVSPVVPTIYTVTVTDANGCQAVSGKAIDVIDIRGGNKMDKVVICHNNNSLVVAGNAVITHLAHGDMLSSCQQLASRSGEGSIEEIAAVKFAIKVLPNPSASYFTINISGNSEETISMKVIDVFGRTVEVHQHLQSDQSLNFGNHYRAGIYFVEISQGKEKTTLKLIKL